MTTRAGTEDLLRPLARRVLGVVVRRFGAFEADEDAAQEALPAVARHWPEQEIPTKRGVPAPRPTPTARPRPLSGRRPGGAVISDEFASLWWSNRA